VTATPTAPIMLPSGMGDHLFSVQLFRGYAPAMTSPAGWYRDPGGAPIQRFWDGAQWTSHTQQMPDAHQMQVVALMQAENARKAQNAQFWRRFTFWVIFGPVILLAVVFLFVFVISAAQTR
jgi:hypothetical protein